MRKNKKIIVLLAMLAFAFTTTQFAFSQESTETEGFETEIEAIDEAGDENLPALLGMLSVEFEVDILVLEDLSAQGYTPGEIWLALEISLASEMTLEDAILVAEGTDGHGWGVLAQALDIKPGSDDFHALKLRWGDHQGRIVREMKEEREQNEVGAQSGQGQGQSGEKGKSESAGQNGKGKR